MPATRCPARVAGFAHLLLASPRDGIESRERTGLLFPSGCHAVLAPKVCAHMCAGGLRPSSNLDRLRGGVTRTVTGNPALHRSRRNVMAQASYAFITDEQFELLLANGRMALAFQENGEHFDPLPVVKLFTPDADATWLLTEIGPRGDDGIRLV